MKLCMKAMIVIAAVVLLTACGGKSEALSQSPTPTPAATVTETAEPSPQPTITVTETVEPEPTDEPSDDESTDEFPPKPQKPENFIRLSGTIILVNRDESADGKTCGRILDVVVDTRGDDVRGIKFVHFHEDDGITIQWQYAQIGDQLEMKITRENFEPALLTRGTEPFPPQEDLTACDDAADPEGEDSDDVLEPFYGEWGIWLPYNAETWKNL